MALLLFFSGQRTRTEDKMKFGFGFETIASAASGKPFYRWYWIQALEWIGATGFAGIEVPYRAWTFNDGRGGSPLCKESIGIKYGGPAKFNELVRQCGMPEGVPALHITASNLLQSMLAMNMPPDKLFDKLVNHGEEALQVLSDMGNKALILSPSPAIGLLQILMRDKDPAALRTWVIEQMAGTVNKINQKAKALGIKVYIRNEFFSFLRGEQVVDFMAMIDQDIGYSPDLAHLQIAGADIVKMLTLFKDKLGFIVFKDSFFVDKVAAFSSATPDHPQTGDNQRVWCELGKGTVPLLEARDLLVKQGYDQWIVFETKEGFEHAVSILVMASYMRKHFMAQAGESAGMTNG
jgi:sugar phosphate isomerase/epimerase